MYAKSINSSFNVGESYVVSTVPFSRDDCQILTVTKITPKMIRFGKDVYFAIRGEYYYGTGATKSHIVYECTAEEMANLSDSLAEHKVTFANQPAKGVTYSVSQYSLRLVKEKSITFSGQDTHITKPAHGVSVATK